MIIWLLALPVAAAVVLLLVGRWKLIAAPLTCAVLFAMSGMLALISEAESTAIAGRSLSLSHAQAVPMALATAMLAITIWATYRAPRQPSHYALCLAGAATLLAGLSMRNMTLSALLLGIAAMFAVMLVPDEHERSPRTGMQIAIQVVLGAMILVMAGWALQGADAQETDTLSHVGAALYVLGLSLLIGMAPFYLSIAPLYRQGNVLAILMLRVMLPVVLVARLVPAIQAANWPGGEAFSGAVLLYGGIATVAAGSLSAMSQREVGTALAYTGLADLGIILIGLGLGTPEAVEASLAHLMSHTVGVTLGCLGLQSIRLVIDHDDVAELDGLVHRAPWACLAFVVGGLSLVGVPGTAGFHGRYVIYRILAVEQRTLALALIGLAAGPGWAVLRCAMAALLPATRPDARREVRWMGLLGLALGVLICVPRLLTTYPDWLPTGWLSALIGR